MRTGISRKENTLWLMKTPFTGTLGATTHTQLELGFTWIAFAHFNRPDLTEATVLFKKHGLLGVLVWLLVLGHCHGDSLSYLRTFNPAVLVHTFSPGPQILKMLLLG